MRRRDPTAKRRAILDAAVEELAIKGFHGANTGVIAKKAGVSVGTIFNLFESKELLANAVFQDCKAKYDELLPQQFEGDQAPREQFRRLFKAFIEMYRQNPHHFVFYENHVHNHFLDASSRMARQLLRDKVHAWVERLQGAGVLKEKPPVLLRAAVMGSFTRLVRESLDDGPRVTPKLLEEMEELAWETVARPEFAGAS
jgi:AcrR family transcriptional regulator